MVIHLEVVAQLPVQPLHEVQHALLRRVALALPEAGDDGRTAHLLESLISSVELLDCVLPGTVKEDHKAQMAVPQPCVVLLLLASIHHGDVFILADEQAEVYATLHVDVVQFAHIVPQCQSILVQIVQRRGEKDVYVCNAVCHGIISLVNSVREIGYLSIYNIIYPTYYPSKIVLIWLQGHLIGFPQPASDTVRHIHFAENNRNNPRPL